ncbi:hypothetical protein N2601_31160 (plasmid) [Rhizobium sp. CB3060]|uniref:hypothetical protein n=1 Tax=Rhizobium sp. CB3060 TaxID=3138255 RepID=UPI0021A52747|nr:hypothetical protein [Rhizobium tropici]UWU25449.1 hypothetical protein N2601_31160 [Rhizobium tropici]
MRRPVPTIYERYRMHVDPSARRALLPLKQKILERFTESNWLELATLTDSYDIVSGHGRLLRSLSFGDSDYEGHILAVLNSIVGRDPTNLQEISEYVDGLEGGGVSLSGTSSTEPRYYIQPSVFRIQNPPQQNDLVSVMMPFSRS